MDALFFLRHSKAEDWEIRQALRGIQRHMPWVRKVWVFGDRPAFLSDDRSVVEHVPHDYVARVGGFRTPVTNFFLMFYLSSLIPNLAFEYLWFCDDFILLDDITPETARQDRYLEDLIQVKNRGQGLWKESLWRTCDLLKRLGYPTYNFETHTPTYYTKQRVLEAYCDFKDFVTEDRWYGMLGPTAILNHALARSNSQAAHAAAAGGAAQFRLTHLGTDRAGFYERAPVYDEVVKACQGKRFLSFDDDALGPGIRRFLEERFPEPSRYEKTGERSGDGKARDLNENVSVLAGDEAAASRPAANGYPAVVLPSRNAIGEFLNRKQLLGEAVEVGTLRGQFANSLLKTWRGRRLHCVDPWREARNDASYLDKNNVSQHEHDVNFAETQRLLGSYASRCQLHRKTSREAVSSFADGSLDFVYLDARHYREAVLEDLNLWFPKLRAGGVLAGHDYLDGDLPSGRFEVKSTVDAWAKSQGLEVVCTGEAIWRSWLIART